MMKFGLIILLFSLALGSSPDDKVVLVSPVLAPPRGARAQVQETAKDFPVLMVLATNVTYDEAEGKVHDGRPVYVQKLKETKKLTKRRRRLSASTSTPLPKFQNRH